MAIVVFGVPANGLGGHGLSASGIPTAPQGAHNDVRALVHPSAATYDTNVTITNALPATVTPPVVLNYTIAVTGVPLNAANVTVDIATWAGSPTATEISDNVEPFVTGQASYSVSLDFYALGGYIKLPTSNYTFVITSTISDPNIAPAGTFANSSSINTSTLIVDNPAVAFTGVVPIYSTMGLAVSFNTSFDPANSGIVANAANVTVGITFSYLEGTCVSYSPTSGCGAYAPMIVANETLPFSAHGAYSVVINASFIAPIGLLGGSLPAGSYAITPSITVLNSANPAFPQRTVQAQGITTFAPTLPVGQIAAPLNTSTGLVVGSNVTISVGYLGSHITNAVVTVTNQSSSNVVYTQGVYVPGTSPHAVAVTWVPGAAGSYTVALTLSTAYAPAVVVQVTNVVVHAVGAAQVTTIETWHNTSILGGLSPGAAAAVLLVVGLVIGMIVALALGRMMWGTGKSSPAQPWSAAKPANECTVCHQSFATPQELADHAKQAHGMS
jgi:hypothetical protein